MPVVTAIGNTRLTVVGEMRWAGQEVHAEVVGVDVTVFDLASDGLVLLWGWRGSFGYGPADTGRGGFDKFAGIEGKDRGEVMEGDGMPIHIVVALGVGGVGVGGV